MVRLTWESRIVSGSKWPACASLRKGTSSRTRTCARRSPTRGRGRGLAGGEREKGLIRVAPGTPGEGPIQVPHRSLSPPSKQSAPFSDHRPLIPHPQQTTPPPPPPPPPHPSP